MTAQEPLSQPSVKRRRWLLITVTAVVLVAIIITVIVRANQFEYDEAAHQRVVEAYGVNVVDWPKYRDAVKDACEFDEDTFELYVLMADDLGLLQLDIQYACPDRMGEFTDITGMPPSS